MEKLKDNNSEEQPLYVGTIENVQRASGDELRVYLDVNGTDFPLNLGPGRQVNIAQTKV